jgi:hypothetical protein
MTQVEILDAARGRDGGYRVDNVEAGFDRHFVKPIKIDVLEDLLAPTQPRRPSSPALL